MIKANFDGACTKNPGGTATAGVYIREDDNVLLREGFYVGEGKGMTSNVAEYAGLIKILTFLLPDHRDTCIRVTGDSKLVIMQMNGDWRIKKGLYRESAISARELAKSFSKIAFYWVPRENNAICDELAEEANLSIDRNTSTYKAISGFMKGKKP